MTEKSDAVREVIEGLAFTNLPLFAAALDVKQRYGLGPSWVFIINLVAQDMDLPNPLATRLGTRRSLISADIAQLTGARMMKLIMRNLSTYSENDIVLFAKMPRDARRI